MKIYKINNPHHIFYILIENIMTFQQFLNNPDIGIHI